MSDNHLKIVIPSFSYIKLLIFDKSQDNYN